MFDSKKVSCYRCGKPCHIAAECKVKTAKTSQVDKVADRAKMFRQKYINLKKGGNKNPPKKKQKALYAEDCIDEELSSDDEDLCLMAITEPMKTMGQFETDMKTAERLSLSSDWNRAYQYKVHNFKLYSDEEKYKIFEILYFDFKDSLDSINDLNSKLTEVKHELNEKIEFIANNQEYKYDLDAQKEAYKNLGLENLELKKKAKHYEEV